MTEIRKTGLRYLRQQLCLIVTLALVALIVMRVSYMNCMLWPIIVSVVFTLVVSTAIFYVWQYLSKNHPEDLPMFFTATSGFRLLLALATMFVYYLIVGKESIMVFFIVFMIFYFASLIHHALFFARVSNRS